MTTTQTTTEPQTPACYTRPRRNQHKSRHLTPGAFIVDCCHWATGTTVIQLRAAIARNPSRPLLVVVPTSPSHVAKACCGIDVSIAAIAVDAETPSSLIAGIIAELNSLDVQVVVLDVSRGGRSDLMGYATVETRIVHPVKVKELDFLLV